MAGPLKLYFDAWPAATPDSGAGLELTQAFGKAFQDAFDDTGTGTFQINRYGDAAQVAACASGSIIRVRFVTGGPFAWNDARYKFAFVIEDSGDDVLSTEEEGGAIWTRGGRGLLCTLEWLVWYDEHFSGAAGPQEDGQWHFPSATAGAIFERSLDEWNARPSPKPKPATITKTFSSTLDSDGVTWTDATDAEILIGVGTDYLTSALFLVGQGIEIAMSPAYVASAWNEGARGQDRSATVVFRAGWNIRDDAGRTMKGKKRRTRALVKGQFPGGGPIYAEATNAETAALEAAIGRRELYVDGGSMSGPPLGNLGRKALKDTKLAAMGPLVLGVTSYPDERYGSQSDGGSPAAVKDLLPYTDYFIGDTVLVHIPGEYGGTPMRLYEISAEESENGEADFTLTLDGRPGVSGSSGPGGQVGEAGTNPHTHPCDCETPSGAVPCETPGVVSVHGECWDQTGVEVQIENIVVGAGQSILHLAGIQNDMNVPNWYPFGRGPGEILEPFTLVGGIQWNDGSQTRVLKAWVLNNPTPSTGSDGLVMFTGTSQARATAQVVYVLSGPMVVRAVEVDHATGTAPAVTVASATGDLVLDLAQWVSGPDADPTNNGTAGAGQTAQWSGNLDRVGGLDDNGAATTSKAAGASSTAFSRTYPISRRWGHLAISMSGGLTDECDEAVDIAEDGSLGEGGTDHYAYAGHTHAHAYQDYDAPAHKAVAITIADVAGDFTATEAEGALAELQARAEAHLADAAGAHAASAVAFTPAGTIAAADTQAAIVEVAAEAAAALAAHAGVPATLDSLTDVAITSPVAAQRLRYDGAAWVNSSLHWEPVVDYLGSVVLDSAGNPQMHEVAY